MYIIYEICTLYNEHCTKAHLFCTLNLYIWAIPRKVAYTLHKKSQLVAQSIKEGE